MWDIFTNISDFFFELFSNDPDAVKRRKELRIIHDVLNSARYKVFNKSQMSVTPALAEGFFQLYQILFPIHDIFVKTLHHPEKKLRDAYSHYVLENQFIGDIASRKQDLGYEEIKQKLLASQNIDIDIKKLNNEFESLVEDLKKQNRKQINQEINELMLLGALATHNFTPLFKKFGFDLAQVGKVKPRFMSVNGEDILPELQDLYFVTAKILFSPLLEKGLYTLVERLSPGQAAANQKKLQKILQKAGQLFQHQCNPNLLLNLIMALKEDPSYSPEILKKDEDFVGEYILESSNKYARDRDRAVREIKEGVLQGDINALFGTGKLLQLQSYNEEHNQKIISASIPSFSHIKAFSLLSSFAQSILKNEILPPLKDILLDAFFQNKEFGNKLSNQFYSAEQLQARIDSFDAKVMDEGKSSIESLLKYTDPRKQTKSGMTVAAKMVENIDRFAQGILEEEVRSLYRLGINLGEILKDYKTPNPKHISNIKGLGGKKNKEIIQGIYDGYNKLNLFLKIMKNFVVVLPKEA
jgi:hypothetical protein